ncbi:MAG: 3'-5' exonuclease [Vigna little leaf phytoplasma]|nr:3'-5' exonuclease [Vigna little leaf phytoplasma]
MTLNYRSGVAIISQANKLLPSTYQLKPGLTIQGQVCYQALVDEQEEALFIINKIKKLINQKIYQYHEMVIIYRKQVLMNVLKTYLKQFHIPFASQKPLYLSSPKKVNLTTTLTQKIKAAVKKLPVPTLNYVRLTSIHQMKGLEAKVVFVIGLEEQIFFPSFFPVSSKAEEKRLVYVAVTRAQERLYLTSVQTRVLYHMKQKLTPLSFLTEMELR